MALMAQFTTAHKRSDPHKITKLVGEVAFKLDLPPAWKIHNVFHRSLLFKKDGKLLPHQQLKSAVRKRPDTSCVTEILWENSTVLHNLNASLMTLLAALDNELWLLKVWPPAELPNQCKMMKICNQGTRIDVNLNSSITQRPLDGFGRPNTHFEAKHQESRSVVFLTKYGSKALCVQFFKET
ncbi:hypothetical protein DSO57_1009630 [Entomophthora muscae]|uniref:Uncharacterized protein n=1 Tax=Entomophthora muscae TaxID=34485 RepID=A0ACC2U5U6_9FUNG|nr:hypothetical protein DSO57_1009630 [Entomophthora muscae]